ADVDRRVSARDFSIQNIFDESVRCTVPADLVQPGTKPRLRGFHGFVRKRQHIEALGDLNHRHRIDGTAAFLRVRYAQGRQIEWDDTTRASGFSDFEAVDKFIVEQFAWLTERDIGTPWPDKPKLEAENAGDRPRVHYGTHPG